MLRKRLENDLYACGRAGLPETIPLAGRQWRRVRTFKHDFFAATGHYEADGEQLVLKVNRVEPFLGIPLAWVGRFLRRREMRLLERLGDLEQVPQLLGAFGRCGFAYRYIEGRSLDEGPEVTDDYFDALAALLGQVHRRGICYLDMNKRGNILLGDDGRPYLIDFQISLILDRPLCRRLCRRLQRYDTYHLLKHKRRLRPDLMRDDEHAQVVRTSRAIRLHRRLVTPLRKLRRRFLAALHRRGILKHDDSVEPTPENDPSRFDT